ncbi:hypothetical protein [Streptomyces fulvoviolaceus]|uniref:hypothetical protein n=1 Tax=Streptomyces fulvoviolaceus TaxID=285535 RepID=UPI0021BE46C1|nr:hypothetical protein [Streptomyces fulvoviolaceus]MCT9076488.1 hypothetical protein [Streptomyces fulvoviolaceus]
MLKRGSTNRALVAGALTFVSAAAGVALAPVASAAPQACTASSLTTGPYEGVGTIRYKSATSTCGDLNLTYSFNSTSRTYDSYAGRLRRSDGTWFTCAKRYVLAYDGSHSINDSTYWLCTDVNDNTPFTVASLNEGGDSVTITH